MKKYLKRWFLPLLIALMSVSGLTACESELFSNNGGEEEVRLPESDEYDEVLCSGGGYHIVLKLVDDFDGAYDMVGVVDDKGDWIHELSANHPFIQNGRVSVGDKYISVDNDSESRYQARMMTIKNCMYYLGEGMFALHYADRGSDPNYTMYNAETGIGFDAGECGKSVLKNPFGYHCGSPGEFHDGYLVTRSDDLIKLVGSDGTVKQTDVDFQGGKYGIYSEGVFFAGNCFYDLDGNIVIDLSEYSPGKFRNEPYFENDKCYLEITNNAGTEYYTEIDHEGNFLYEPKKK